MAIMSSTTFALYTAIAAICIGTMVVLGVLVIENNRLSKTQKHRFFLTFLTIQSAVVFEWLGIFLNGDMQDTVVLHRVVKALDYIVSPLAAIMFVMQIGEARGWHRYVVYPVVVINVTMQIASIFTGWTFYVDPVNNVYFHGPLYIVNVIVYVLSIVYVFVEFLYYGSKFKRKNRLSIFMILALLLIGVIIQEAFGSHMRTFVLAFTIGTVLMYIHLSEYYQQETDDTLKAQQKLLDYDILTGAFSRFAYNNRRGEMEKPENIPDDTYVFSFDVNGLKDINDTLGHKAGDELLQGAAFCLRKVFGPHGRVYRIGGDEFAAIIALHRTKPEELKEFLEVESASWKGKYIDGLSVSAGFASKKEFPEYTFNELFDEADKRMYHVKGEYYFKKNKKIRDSK